MGNNHACCAGHCCVIHGCKYCFDDCPVVTEQEPQLGACYECHEDHQAEDHDVLEYDNAPYGCPHCGSSRIIFSGHYDIPEGTSPTVDSPFVRYVLCLTCKHKGQWADFKGHKDRQIRSTLMSNPFNFGHLITGVVEQDPMTDRYVIRGMDAQSNQVTFDVLEALEALKGQSVRFTLASLEDLAKIAKMVEEQGSGDVLGVGTVGGGKS